MCWESLSFRDRLCHSCSCPFSYMAALSLWGSRTLASEPQPHPWEGWAQRPGCSPLLTCQFCPPFTGGEKPLCCAFSRELRWTGRSWETQPRAHALREPATHGPGDLRGPSDSPWRDTASVRCAEQWGDAQCCSASFSTRTCVVTHFQTPHCVRAVCFPAPSVMLRSSPPVCSNQCPAVGDGRALPGPRLQRRWREPPRHLWFYWSLQVKEWLAHTLGVWRGSEALLASLE